MRKIKFTLALALAAASAVTLASCGKIDTPDVETAPVELLNKYIKPKNQELKYNKINIVNKNENVNYVVQSNNSSVVLKYDVSTSKCYLYNMATESNISEYDTLNDGIANIHSDGFIEHIKYNKTNENYKHCIYDPNGELAFEYESEDRSNTIILEKSKEYKPDTIFGYMDKRVTEYSIEQADNLYYQIYIDGDIQYSSTNTIDTIDAPIGSSRKIGDNYLYVLTSSNSYLCVIKNEEGNELGRVSIPHQSIYSMSFNDNKIMYQYSIEVPESEKYDYISSDEDGIKRYKLSTFIYDLTTFKLEEIDANYRFLDSFYDYVDDEYFAVSYYEINDGVIDNTSIKLGFVDLEGELVYKHDQIEYLEDLQNNSYKFTDGNLLIDEKLYDSNYNFIKDLDFDSSFSISNVLPNGIIVRNNKTMKYDFIDTSGNYIYNYSDGFDTCENGYLRLEDNLIIDAWSNQEYVLPAEDDKSGRMVVPVELIEDQLYGVVEITPVTTNSSTYYKFELVIQGSRDALVFYSSSLSNPSFDSYILGTNTKAIIKSSATFYSDSACTKAISHFVVEK